MTTARLVNKRVAVFVEAGFEDLESWVTVIRLHEDADGVWVGCSEAFGVDSGELTA